MVSFCTILADIDSQPGKFRAGEAVIAFTLAIKETFSLGI
jgi:hypothetical protein